MIPRHPNTLLSGGAAHGTAAAREEVDRLLRWSTHHTLLDRQAEAELGEQIARGRRRVVRATLSAPAVHGELLRLVRLWLPEAEEARLAAARLACAGRAEPPAAAAAEEALGDVEAALAAEGLLMAALDHLRRHLRRYARWHPEARVTPRDDDLGATRAAPSSGDALAPAPAVEARRHLAEIERGEAAVRQATTVLLESNLRLVAKVAYRYLNRGLPPGDLVQEGAAGLLRAISGFDHRRGLRFSTFAVWWIRQAITRAIADQGRTVRLPVPTSSAMRRLVVFRDDLVRERAREPLRDEVAARSRLPLDKVEQLLTLFPQSLSLDQGAQATIAEAEPPPPRLRSLADPAAISPAQAFDARERLEVLERALRTLAPREAVILRRHFGLDGHPPRSLQAIGDELNLTRERVRQLERHALERLRDSPFRRSLRDLLAAESG